MTNRLYNHLTHVMEWSPVSRSCIPLAFIVFLYGMHLVWATSMLHLPGGTAVLNVACFNVQLPVIVAIMATSLLLLSVGLFLRTRHPDARWFQYIGTTFYGLALVWGGYLTGTLNMATGVVLMGAPIVGFVLLERHVVLVALGVAFAAVLAFNIASAWSYLPYAPLLHPPHDRASATLWVFSQLLLAGPHLISSITQVGLVLGQWRYREAAALRLSLTDALTGMHNRRSIMETLVRELAHAQRRRHPLAVALLDLDHFKQINDRWGHPTGDRVLSETARLIGSNIRAGDALGRFGGEEFILVLPDTSREQAIQLIERCRQQLAGLHVSADTGEAVPVRASFGLAWMEAGHATSPEALIHSADTALYEAKAAGRDCLVLAAKACGMDSAAGPLPAEHIPRLRRWQSDEKTPWWQPLADILEWSPVEKASLVMGISSFMAANLWFWLLYVLHRNDHAALINVALAEKLLVVAPTIAVLALVGLVTGLVIRKHNPRSRRFQRFVLHAFGLSLVSLGYCFGMLNMPTGVMLICSPLLGFILFDSAIVLEVFFTSLAAVIALAYACASGWLPYAPLVSTHGTAWQFTSPFWVATNYFFTTWAMIVVMVLTDRILGRWREREAEIHLLGQTDALTQVSNRRHILDQLGKYLAQSRRDGSALTVVLLDLDYFKRINDKWGHPAGDRVLQVAARTLGGILRQGDGIGRYGGEEFMLLLRDTTGPAALTLVERCRTALMAAEVFADNGERIGISASFGMAWLEASSERTADRLIKSADMALYEAKAGGRNRIEMAARVPEEATATA